ncbi:NAD-dependent epimerase/dehydratase family protein [Cellulomonas sp. Sa3CUA2]|uniref:NAD-dependent epimerase/dehydratase family protein n=1 Tax=Cellulomonas avistercoris TaxID=2762242 RepID=A0ABR8QIE7_9CELL|nr:NAD-dependent epimerase/dehydratase family protein [Cellulomonas avistercoris]MBD7920212.1 NAD-dependent epimerase/dehydratase family protein [Cellulomonas avistercoris]
MTNCLVTGGAGFIGTAVAAALADRFDEVVAMDVLHPDVHPDRARPAALDARVRLVARDVADAAAWDEVLDGFAPDVVIHLAAETGTAVSVTETTRHARANVIGTTEMLDALLRHGVAPPRVVLTSSRAVYGEGAYRVDGAVVPAPLRSHQDLAAGRWQPAGEPVAHRADAVVARPASTYAATKLAQEHLLSSWASAHDAAVTVLRLQNVYGPGQSLTNPYTGIVPFFAQIARDGGSIPVYEDGRIVRDFVHIDDVAAAVLKTLDVPPSTVPLDIGTGRGTTVLELAEIVAAHYGAPAPTVTGQFREGDVRWAVADVEPARAALGWEPRVDLRSGIAGLCAWIDGVVAR